jgi:murein DD-endopeptidase MepM/ murein hydrolase activator NlpD
MKCCGWLLLIFLLITGPANADWDLTPAKVAAGEVVVLRWQGGAPPDFVVGRFADQLFYCESDGKGGLFALIGVDIEQVLGTQAITLLAFDKNGTGVKTSLALQVIDKERGVDRLTLPPEMVTPKDPAILKRIAKDNQMLQELFSSQNGSLLAGPFRVPVTDPVSSQFGKKRILNGVKRSPHSGTDFRSPFGRPVKSPARGRVVFVGDLYYTGRTVVLDHGAGLYTLYAHFQKSSVRTGDVVEPGAVLGKVGSSGRSTGAHLHWTVRLRGSRIDPLSLLKRFGAESP